jgi:hypothetical protein
MTLGSAAPGMTLVTWTAIIGAIAGLAKISL